MLFDNTLKMHYLHLWYVCFCYGLLEVWLYYIHFHAAASNTPL